jgi:hypothetical protein
MHIVYAQRHKNYDPIVLAKDVNGVGKAGDVIDDGTATVIRIGAWDDKKVAKNFAANVQESVDAIKKKLWKIWVE